MPASLDQFNWCNVPLLPPVPDPAWEAEFKKCFGRTTTFTPYLTPVRWMFHFDEIMESRVTLSLAPELDMLISLAVAMDNCCRYCNGAFQSVLKIVEYSKHDTETRGEPRGGRTQSTTKGRPRIQTEGQPISAQTLSLLLTLLARPVFYANLTPREGK